MGEVYRAHDTRLDRDVAIKVLTPTLSSDAAAVARFEREAKAVAALSHSAILAIHDFGSHEGTAYAVTELLEGETLRERLAGSLPVRTALEYGVQVAEGLAAAHEKGLVHRDLKPENLFVTTEGRVKILDFGLVRRTETQADGEIATVSGSTVPGTLLGTVGYMSPEQASGRPVDFRSDQFSLGCVLYEMLSGRRPFARPSSPETLSAIIRDEPAPIVALNPSVPGPLRWIVERCLAKEPAARYASTHDLARELRTLLEHLPEATPFGDATAVAHTRTATSNFRGVTNRKLAAGAAATALLMIVAGAVYLVTTRRVSTSIDSLAVLPFTNEGGNPQTDYLSDGITEVLINSLSQLPRLRVLARTTVFRYKSANDPIKVARELGVRALLTGKVIQRDDQLTIQVDLVDVANGAQLWGEQYKRQLADVLSVQEEIARHISETLRPRLTGEQQQRLARHSTKDAEAYRLYLRGRFHWNRLTEEDLVASIDYFKQALARDPNYALAYVGLSDSYGMLGQTYRSQKEVAGNSKDAFEKALALDESLPEAHLARGAYELFFAWKLERRRGGIAACHRTQPEPGDGSRRVRPVSFSNGQVRPGDFGEQDGGGRRSRLGLFECQPGADLLLCPPA